MNTPHVATEIDSDRPASPPSSRGRWLVVVIAIGLVAIPLLWSELPAEVARWFCASAVEAELEDDLPRACARMDQAIRWAKTESDLYAYRSSLELKRGDLAAAMQDADRAVTLAPKDSIYALSQRGAVHQRQGDHAAALADVEQIVELAADGTTRRILPTGQVFDMPYTVALNMRAYWRALAGIEIEQGLVDIQEAFERVGTEDVAAYLDTRGYLRFLSDDLDGAEQDIERAVKLAEAEMAKFHEQEPVGDRRLWDRLEKQYEENLAVMLQHRGQVREAQGREKEAADDFLKADQYGYSPEKGVW